jgi:hypothetical protein
MLSKASLAGSLILLAASRTGGGRSVDFGQKILAEREGAKRLLASRRVSMWATGAQETAQLSFPTVARFNNKELNLSRRPQEPPLDLSVKVCWRSFTCL